MRGASIATIFIVTFVLIANGETGSTTLRAPTFQEFLQRLQPIENNVHTDEGIPLWEVDLDPWWDQFFGGYKQFMVATGGDAIGQANLTYNYEYPFLGVTWEGSFGLYDGVLKGIETLHRDAPTRFVISSLTPNPEAGEHVKLSFFGGLGVDFIREEFRARMEWMGYTTANIGFTAHLNDLRIDFYGDFTTNCTFDLSRFDIVPGSVDIDVSQVVWPLNIIIEWVATGAANLLKNVLVNSLEVVIRDVVLRHFLQDIQNQFCAAEVPCEGIPSVNAAIAANMQVEEASVELSHFPALPQPMEMLSRLSRRDDGDVLFEVDFSEWWDGFFDAFRQVMERNGWDSYKMLFNTSREFEYDIIGTKVPGNYSMIDRTIRGLHTLHRTGEAKFTIDTVDPDGQHGDHVYFRFTGELGLEELGVSADMVLHFMDLVGYPKLNAALKNITLHFAGRIQTDCTSELEAHSFTIGSTEVVIIDLDGPLGELAEFLQQLLGDTVAVLVEEVMSTMMRWMWEDFNAIVEHYAVFCDVECKNERVGIKMEKNGFDYSKIFRQLEHKGL